MYRVKVIDEDDGRVLTDAGTDGIALVYSAGETGIYAHSFMNCGEDDEFHIALSLDKLRDHILRRSPRLELMYLLRDEFIETTEIDVGAIQAAIEKMRGDTKDDEC